MTGRALAPHFLIRVAGIPWHQLVKLQSNRANLVCDEIAQCRDLCEGLKTQICAALHAVLPNADKHERSDILKLKRAVFNCRMPNRPAQSFILGRRVLSSSDFKAFRLWIAAVRRLHQLTVSGAAAIAADIDQARASLKRMVAEGSIRGGLQLSGDIGARIERYSEQAENGSADRRLDLTIYSYLTRAATKPSPFADFATLELGFWDRDPTKSLDKERIVRLTRLYTDTFLVAISRLESEHALFEACLEPSLEIVGDIVRFLTGGVACGLSVSGERVVSLNLTPSLSQTITILGSRTVKFPDLVSEISHALGHELLTVNKYVRQLVEIGLIRLTVGIDERDGDYSGRLKSFADEAFLRSGHPCWRLLAELLEIEHSFAVTCPSRRVPLIKEGFRKLFHLTEALSLPKISPSITRTFLYEDVLRWAKPHSRDVAVPIDDLRKISIIVSLFDNGHFDRLVLLSAFKYLFPNKKRVRLLDFYIAFKGLNPTLLKTWWLEHVSKPKSKLAITIFQMRAEFLAKVKSLSLERSPVQLESAWLDDWLARVPSELMPAESTTHFIQLTGDNATQWVWNKSSVGFGRYFSRFASEVEGRNLSYKLYRSLLQQWRSYKTSPADICATMGVNVNIHPRLSSLNLVYPGANAILKEGDIRPSEVTVLLNVDHLDLFSDRFGKINLCPLGLLYPAHAPPFYRFLSRFSALLGGGTSFWDLISPSMPFTEQLRRFPRICLGNVVLERETYEVAKSVFQDLGPPGSFAEYEKLRAIACRLGLPKTAFIRSAAVKPFLDDVPRASWLESVRSRKIRKPSYVDFDSWLSIATLMKNSRLYGDVLKFQEALPATPDDRSAGFATEWLIEMASGGRSRSAECRQ